MNTLPDHEVSNCDGESNSFCLHKVTAKPFVRLSLPRYFRSARPSCISRCRWMRWYMLSHSCARKSPGPSGFFEAPGGSLGELANLTWSRIDCAPIAVEYSGRRLLKLEYRVGAREANCRRGAIVSSRAQERIGDEGDSGRKSCGSH